MRIVGTVFLVSAALAAGLVAKTEVAKAEVGKAEVAKAAKAEAVAKAAKAEAVANAAKATKAEVPKAEAPGWGVFQISPQTIGETVAVSRDGNTALIANPYKNAGAGAVYVYVRDGQAWRLQATLTPSDGAVGFGGNEWDDNTIALSADGNIALIGINPNPTGAVYAFVRDGELWREQQKLIRPDASETGTDGFGRSVASSDDGNTIVVGDAPFFFNFGSSPQGSAYVLKRVGDHWVSNAHLISSTGNSAFGRSVAISGDGGKVAVGSPRETYVFTAVGNEQWREQAILSPADKVTFGEFGQSVALSQSGNTVVVGNSFGAAYIFQQQGNEGSWEEEAKLGSTITNKSWLGFSVDIDNAGVNAVVGDWAQGTAFLFHRTTDSNGLVQGVPQRVLAKEGGTGSSVAISGDANTIVVGYGVYVLSRQ
jgi:hypothetical protein